MTSEKAKIISRHLQTHIPLSSIETLLVSDCLDFVFALYGKLLIRGYRYLFTANNITVMTKRFHKVTHYLLVSLTQHPISLEEIKEWIQPSLLKLKRISEVPCYELWLGHLDSSEVSCYNSSLISVEPNTSFKYDTTKTQESEVTFQSTLEFIELNRIVNEYLDRMGRVDMVLLQERLISCRLSFQLQPLLRTVEYILAKQLIASPFCQVESEEYSRFDVHRHEFQIKKRHTILRGEGNVLLIHWLFIQPIQHYLNLQRVEEFSSILQHYESRHESVTMKIFCVENNLAESNIRYNFKEKETSFERIPLLKRQISALIKGKAYEEDLRNGKVECISLDD